MCLFFRPDTGLKNLPKPALKQTGPESSPMGTFFPFLVREPNGHLITMKGQCEFGEPFLITIANHILATFNTIDSYSWEKGILCNGQRDPHAGKYV